MPKKARILQELEDYKPTVEIKLYQFKQADGTMVYGPHPHQKEIIEDKHRYKVVVCGRRFGKTSFAINELLYNALNKDGSVYWYVGPTYRQAKMIAWRMLEDILLTLPPELVLKKNEQELVLTLGNGSRIEIKGADNEDSLRGVALDGVVMDEYAFMKSRVFTKIIRPALADRKGWMIFIGTPYGYNHFYELYLKGQGNDHEWKSWRFRSLDNPFIDPVEIESARSESSPEVFAQEWEADFRMFKGLIYKEFDPKLHVVDKETNPGSTFYRTMDFGASNPTACLWIEIDRDDNIYIFDEYYETGHSIDYHAGVILARHPTLEYRATFGDPSALQEHIDYAHWQLYITPATRFFTSAKGTSESWVNAGISMVSTVLRQDPVTKLPKLLIHPRCVNLIREFQGYEWDEIRGIIVDKPKKQDDHALDALRYFICSYGGSHKKDRKHVYQPTSTTTGY
jgi:hypothetical protein